MVCQSPRFQSWGSGIEDDGLQIIDDGERDMPQSFDCLWKKVKTTPIKFMIQCTPMKNSKDMSHTSPEPPELLNVKL